MLLRAGLGAQEPVLGLGMRRAARAGVVPEVLEPCSTPRGADGGEIVVMRLLLICWRAGSGGCRV